jgi:hypothetical protein
MSPPGSGNAVLVAQGIRFPEADKSTTIENTHDVMSCQAQAVKYCEQNQRFPTHDAWQCGVN